MAFAKSVIGLLAMAVPLTSCSSNRSSAGPQPNAAKSQANSAPAEKYGEEVDQGTQGDVANKDEAKDDSANPIPDKREPQGPSFFTSMIPLESNPSVVEKDGVYYYCFATDDSIFVARSEKLQDVGKGRPEEVFLAFEGENVSKFSDPQLQFIGDRWYIYFSADDRDLGSRGIYALEGSSIDPTSFFFLRSRVKALNDQPAFNASTVTINEQAYLIWSGTDSAATKQRNIYIAPMLTPLSLDRRPDFVQRFEAETALIKDAQILRKKSASGGSSVALSNLATSSVEFTVTVPSAGSFAMDIAVRGVSKAASQQLFVNNQLVESVAYPLGDSLEGIQTVTRAVNLNAGSNKVKIQKGEGAVEVDYIELKSPNFDRVAIASPEQAWERVGPGPFVNEKPAALQHEGKTFIVFSANDPASDDRALGILELVGTDPMRRESWKKSGPVFASSSEILSPGSAVFVRTADGAEDWMFYDHKTLQQGVDLERDVSAQRFTFDANGFPAFGSPGKN